MGGWEVYWLCVLVGTVRSRIAVDAPLCGKCCHPLLRRLDIVTGGGVGGISGVANDGERCGRHKPLEVWCLDFSWMSHHFNPCLGLNV